MNSGEMCVLPDEIDPQTWFNPKYLNYQHPEVARFLGSLTFYPEINNSIVTPDRVYDLLLEGGYEHSAEIEIPVNGGSIDSMELCIPITERLAERDEVLLPGLSGFKRRYATVNGATEGINNLMLGMSVNGTMKKVGYIRGDYTGYLGAAKNTGSEVVSANSLEEIGQPQDGVVWFISNPSAINGNLYSPDVWKAFLDAGHKVVVDAAYIDLTLQGNKIDVSAENIIAVVTSPSKPYGLVLDKYPAVIYTRESNGVLDQQQRNFNNVSRLLTIMEVQLQEQFGPHKIAELLRPTQLAICSDLGAIAGGVVLPSDATLMAHAKGTLHQDFDTYRTVNMLERPEDYTFRLIREFARRAQLERQTVLA